MTGTPPNTWAGTLVQACSSDCSIALLVSWYCSCAASWLQSWQHLPYLLVYPADVRKSYIHAHKGIVEESKLPTTHLLNISINPSKMAMWPLLDYFCSGILAEHKDRIHRQNIHSLTVSRNYLLASQSSVKWGKAGLCCFLELAGFWCCWVAICQCSAFFYQGSVASHFSSLILKVLLPLFKNLIPECFHLTFFPPPSFSLYLMYFLPVKLSWCQSLAVPSNGLDNRWVNPGARDFSCNEFFVAFAGLWWFFSLISCYTYRRCLLEPVNLCSR